MNLNIIIATATNKFKQKMNDFCQNSDFGQLTPEKTCSLFSKYSMFNPSATAIKHMVTNAGKLVKENARQINTEIRKKEKIPKKIRAVVISMDGVNVLLNEPGVKKD